MKKIYHQFNHLNIDVDLEPMEVSAFEKEKIKRTVLKTKKKKHITRNIVAAVIFLAVSSVTVGSTFPAFAANIPIIGNVFKLFIHHEKYVFDHYDTYSTNIGMSKESNGVEVTVTDAVYDGENITIAYTITSETDLGERPILEGDLIADELKNRYRDGGYDVNYIVQKISNHEYAVLFVYELIRGTKPDKVHITLEGDQIIDLNNVNNSVQGSWSFAFALNKLESIDEKLNKANLTTQINGIRVSAAKLTKTPISTAFYLTEEAALTEEDGEWRGLRIDYTISDNLGNKYNSIHYKGTGHSTDFEGRANHPRITIKNVDERATSVIITPIVNVYKMNDHRTGELKQVNKPYEMNPIKVPVN